MKTLEELQDLCDLWIERLSLGEWRGRTKVLFKTPKALAKITGTEAEAGCWWSASECRAEIYLLRKFATEAHLLHEVLHLLLQGHTTYSALDEMVERTIERLTVALLLKA